MDVLHNNSKNPTASTSGQNTEDTSQSLPNANQIVVKDEFINKSPIFTMIIKSKKPIRPKSQINPLLVSPPNSIKYGRTSLDGSGDTYNVTSTISKVMEPKTVDETIQQPIVSRNVVASLTDDLSNLLINVPTTQTSTAYVTLSSQNKTDETIKHVDSPEIEGRMKKKRNRKKQRQEKTSYKIYTVYFCSNGHHWTSAHGWTQDFSQRCRKCFNKAVKHRPETHYEEAARETRARRPFVRHYGRDGIGGHNYDLCDMCQMLGYSCVALWKVDYEEFVSEDALQVRSGIRSYK